MSAYYIALRGFLIYSICFGRNRASAPRVNFKEQTKNRTKSKKTKKTKCKTQKNEKQKKHSAQLGI
ncbi:MAG: hypothetical protein J6104_04810, partial [Methanomicrobium sp.]|nr:hypothetical protein [Methanomicrobium sp.]